MQHPQSHKYTWCAATFELGQSPTTKESQAVGDELFSDFVSKECDKVELIYTKFVSLISSEPIVQTLLPLTPQVGLFLTTCGSRCIAGQCAARLHICWAMGTAHQRGTLLSAEPQMGRGCAVTVTFTLWELQAHEALQP